MNKFLQLNRLIIFFISIGLLVLAFEIYLQHFDQLQEKPVMWTPIVFGFTGGLSGLLMTLIFNRLSYYSFLVLMTISILVGTLGLFLHNRWRFPSFSAFLFHGKPLDFEILTTYTPLLSPSSFIAIGGLGILVAIFNRWGN